MIVIRLDWIIERFVLHFLNLIAQGDSDHFLSPAAVNRLLRQNPDHIFVGVAELGRKLFVVRILRTHGDQVSPAGAFVVLREILRVFLFKIFCEPWRFAGCVEANPDAVNIMVDDAVTDCLLPAEFQLLHLIRSVGLSIRLEDFRGINHAESFHERMPPERERRNGKRSVFLICDPVVSGCIPFETAALTQKIINRPQRPVIVIFQRRQGGLIAVFDAAIFLIVHACQICGVRADSHQIFLPFQFADFKPGICRCKSVSQIDGLPGKLFAFPDNGNSAPGHQSEMMLQFKCGILHGLFRFRRNDDCTCRFSLLCHLNCIQAECNAADN